MKSRGYSIFVLGSILLLLLAQHAIATKPVTALAPKNGLSHKVGNDTTSGKHGEVEDEKKYEYIVGKAKGPEKWGDLNTKEWGVCKTGKLQSPIDLSSLNSKAIPQSQDLKAKYRPGDAVITNRGHDIAVVWDHGEAGIMAINGTKYTLKQCHWHTPSEHTMDGKRFDLELHMVHARKKRNSTVLAVVGVLYRIGAPDPFLTTLIDDLAEVSSEHKEKTLGELDPNRIIGASFPYYRYLGSLTTPPCTEGVIWTVSKKVRTASMEQIQKLQEAVQDNTPMNARPVQNLNNREIRLYGV